MTIKIKIMNCNNIEEGNLSIKKNHLNIKYGINGTGKSTITKAIEYANTDKMNLLLPFKYQEKQDVEPKIEISKDLHKIAIFNEEMVNRFIFVEGDLLENSFDVLFRPADYQERMKNITELSKHTKTLINENENFDLLIFRLETFIKSFNSTKTKQLSNSSILSKGILGRSPLKKIPHSLIDYKSFLNSSNSYEWLSWQNKGLEYLNTLNKCPFCTSDLNESDLGKIREISETYDAKEIKTFLESIKVIENIEDYLVVDVLNVVMDIKQNPDIAHEEEKQFLISIKEQATILQKMVHKVKSIDYSSLKDEKSIQEVLEASKIDLEKCKYFKNEQVVDLVASINLALDNTITNAVSLRKEIMQLNSKLRKAVEEFKPNINSFLRSAGYKYEVDVVSKKGSHEYCLILKSSESKREVKSVKTTLSYGERNAFALVLFMYKTKNEKPDLIILDDPISSFDKHKKYAILHSLFGKKKPFDKKTVLMLTHDFDPVVDMISSISKWKRHDPKPQASFIINKSGILSEEEITLGDISSFYEILNSAISSSIDEIIKLIYMRRLSEALGDKNEVWDLLSNLFHKEREIPVKNDRVTPLSDIEIKTATENISEVISNFDYGQMYARMHNQSVITNLYDLTDSPYEKIQLYRLMCDGKVDDPVLKKFIDEVYHIENDTLFQLNPRKYCTIPDYIIAECDKEVRQIKETLQS